MSVVGVNRIARPDASVLASSVRTESWQASREDQTAHCRTARGRSTRPVASTRICSATGLRAQSSTTMRTLVKHSRKEPTFFRAPYYDFLYKALKR